MRVLLLNENDSLGGASRASYRLFEGLRKLGVDSSYIVQRKVGVMELSEVPALGSSRFFGRVRPYLDALPRKRYRHRDKTIFFPAFLPDSLGSRISSSKPDLLHLHWVVNGMIRIESLPRFDLPLVWTLHDMWAFTGGCTYSAGCRKFQEGCGACPVLGSSDPKDLSRKTWERKRRAWGHLPLVVVTPSGWMGRMAASSPILEGKRIEVIPNGLDLMHFKPGDKAAARKKFGLPQDRKVALFGAMSSTDDPRKGYRQLVDAMGRLPEHLRGDDVVLAVFGSEGPKEGALFPFEVRYLGTVKKEQDLALLYSACDLFIAPSLEDNLPNTVMESLACGTPCVAFRIGGMPDMIEHQKCGYLAEPFDPDDLARGMAWLLSDEDLLNRNRLRARAIVEERFELGTVAGRYLDLYRDLLEMADRNRRDSL